MRRMRRSCAGVPMQALSEAALLELLPRASLSASEEHEEVGRPKSFAVERWSRGRGRVNLHAGLVRGAQHDGLFPGLLSRSFFRVFTATPRLGPPQWPIGPDGRGPRLNLGDASAPHRPPKAPTSVTVNSTSKFPPSKR